MLFTEREEIPDNVTLVIHTNLYTQATKLLPGNHTGHDVEV